MAKNQAVDMLNNPKRSLPERHKEKPFTKKQQAFIQHYVYHDLTNTEAAHRAGYSNPRQIAYVLLHDPRYMNVQMKIRELQEAQQKKYEITFARDLQMIRDRAVEDGSYGAAVTAELGRAKLAGLMVEKKEIKHGRIDQMDRSEVEARLNALLDKNQLMPGLRAAVVDDSVIDVEDVPDDDVEEAQFEDAEFEEQEDEEPAAEPLDGEDEEDLGEDYDLGDEDDLGEEDDLEPDEEDEW
jgi:phage terminase small subunit